MKELTIEQKAKAYDEKYKEEISRATQLWECGDITRENLEYIFPELKEESEDEKIRKEIIDYIKTGTYHKSWIAWLEKQKTSEEAMQYLKENHSPSEVSDFQAAMNIAVAKAYDKGVKDGLENKGQTFTKEEVGNANKVEPKDYNGIDPYFGKPVDKVEPKFQNGQWIVWQGKYYKVNDNGCGYELVDQNGLNTSLEYGTVDESAHVWDITKDAMDGDVLVASDKSLFIYDGSINENGNVGFYIAFAEDMDIILNSDDSCGWEAKDFCHPATKEQRNALFKAMADAGWEFDFKKKELKELKNVEQKPSDEVKPKFKVCEWLTENHPNSYARFMQILEIINVQGKKRYRISRDLHNDEDIVECRFVEDNWHSFNIRDIKDGDILVASDGSVFIYAGSTDIYAKFYVALTKCGILNLEGGNWEDKKSVYPAAKEQRERFFAAMHDAGYEFDFEKKKLKKIEQKSAWSEEDELKRSTLIHVVKKLQGSAIFEGLLPEELIAWLKSLKQRIKL